ITVAAEFAQLIQDLGPTVIKTHDFAERAEGMPLDSRRVASSLVAGFGAVSSLSPKKMELAPARKQRNCNSRLMRSRPALRRTRARGNALRATAMQRRTYTY